MNPQRLNDEQIERLEITARELARRGNFVGLALEQALTGKSAAEQRATLIVAYSQTYEAMLVLQMALNSLNTPAEIAARLREIKEKQKGEGRTIVHFSRENRHG